MPATKQKTVDIAKMRKVAGNILEFEGKYYKFEAEEHGIMSLIPLTEKQVNELDKITNKIIELIEKDVDVKLILKDALSTLDIADIKGIHKRLTKKPRAKPTMDLGCIVMKIGQYELSLRD
jgi:hypothetical protein